MQFDPPKPAKVVDSQVVSIDTDGRDEMNLAEFPIAALTDRVPQGRNTIRFADGSGSLMITGSDAYGLPTPADADVVVALIQLTKRRNGFKALTVPFNRTELLAILGWPESGKSYNRLTESLMRWSTTSLRYEGTWWDQQSRRKINAVFHILNEVVLLDRAGRDSVPGLGPQSYFAWNKIFLSSCQAGNLKRLDLGLYFNLEHASSKRLYRFLDKRLYRQPDQTFDLADMAFERVGLSRGYVGKKGGINIAKVREKLRPAIEELEACGFLVPMSSEARYRKVEASWTIRFVRSDNLENQETAELSELGGEGRDLHPVDPLNESIEQLVARGVTRRKAEALVEHYALTMVDEQIKVFDWKLANDTTGMKRNPAGWLVKAIEDGYQKPRKLNGQPIRESRSSTQGSEELRDARADARSRDRKVREIDSWINQLAASDRARLEAEALAAASEEMRQQQASPSLTPSLRKALLFALMREHVASKPEGIEFATRTEKPLGLIVPV